MSRQYSTKNMRIFILLYFEKKSKHRRWLGLDWNKFEVCLQVLPLPQLVNRVRALEVHPQEIFEKITNYNIKFRVPKSCGAGIEAKCK